MSFGNFLPGFEVRREGNAPDGQGGHVKTWALSSTVSGRLSPVSASELREFEHKGSKVTHRFSTPISSDVKVGDQITRAGIVVTVDAVRHTSNGRRKECLCTEIGS